MCFILPLCIPSTSPFFVLFKIGFNTLQSYNVKTVKPITKAFLTLSICICHCDVINRLFSTFLWSNSHQRQKEPYDRYSVWIRLLQSFGKGMFTRYDCNCNLFLTTNRLYGIWFCCLNRTTWTLRLNLSRHSHWTFAFHMSLTEHGLNAFQWRLPHLPAR